MVNQKANVNTKTHQQVYLLILALIVTYGVCFLLRMMEYSAWQASYLQIAGEKLMATHDAYAWLAGAKGVNRYSGSPLSELVLLISKVTGLSPGNVGFWLPAIMAPTDIAPVIRPIIMPGYHILIFRTARLSPTARASILVAMLSITMVIPLEGSFFCISGFLSKPSAIILMPVKPRSKNAIQ